MSQRRNVRILFRKALAKLRNVSAEREQASLTDAIALLEELKDENPRPRDIGRVRRLQTWSDWEYMEALVDALEGDDTDAVLDAYDAACEALGKQPDELGEWIDNLYDEPTERTDP